jgi:hypothetical protein
MGDADKSLHKMFTDVVKGDADENSSEMDKEIMNNTPHLSNVKRELFEKGKGRIVGNSFPNEPWQF